MTVTPSRGGQSNWAWLVAWAVLGLPACALPVIDLNRPTLWPDIVQPLLLHPSEGWQQNPLSWWATAWVHGSQAHLAQNLAGLTILTALAGFTRTPGLAVLAWAMAWPLTHLGMLWRPELHTYIGLSGVLHAGAAILALYQTLAPTRPPFRLTGPILGAGLVWKVLMENPWNTVLFLSESSAINVAPWAHFCGLMAGLMAGGVCWLLSKQAPPQFKRH